MPLASVQGGVSLAWTLSVSNNPYAATIQGPDQSQSFSLANLATATWNQLYAHQFLISGGSFIEFDLTSLTNLVNESFAFAHVLAIMLLPVGVSCRIGPGQTNGLQWFWDDGTAYDTVAVNGCFFWCDDPAGSGTAVSAGSKTLRVSNPNGSQCSVALEVLGSTN